MPFQARISARLAGGLSLLLLAFSGAEARQADVASLRAQFVGNWELVSYVTFRGGEPVDMNYVGRILYDEHGNMSAIGMPRDLPQRAAESGTTGGLSSGFAYFATYTIEPEAGRVLHHVHGSPVQPNWVGTDLVRYYEFTDELLKLSIRNASGGVTGTLTWRRLR